MTGGRRSPATRRRRADGGSVTAETALAFPVVVAVLAVLLGAGQVVINQIRCVDAARAGARAAARAEPQVQVSYLTRVLAPPAATIGVSRGRDLVRVEISGATDILGPLPPVPLRCHAVAAAELP
jgi:Flp pilus assembly protein TadG